MSIGKGAEKERPSRPRSRTQTKTGGRISGEGLSSLLKAGKASSLKPREEEEEAVPQDDWNTDEYGIIIKRLD